MRLLRHVPARMPEDDALVEPFTEVPSPEALINSIPANSGIATLVGSTRKTIRRLAAGSDGRLLVVVDASSIDDQAAALDLATFLARARTRYARTLEIVMQVQWGDQRTIAGSQGVIEGAYSDGSCRFRANLFAVRKLLVNINRLGIPTAIRLRDTFTPQYFTDLISWGTIGIDAVESQIHREFASHGWFPIGFESSPSRPVKVVVDAIQTAAIAHTFMSFDKAGQVALVSTRGNGHCHVVLREDETSNFDKARIANVCRQLDDVDVLPRVMVAWQRQNGVSRSPSRLQAMATGAAVGSRKVFGVTFESDFVGESHSLSHVRGDPLFLENGRDFVGTCPSWNDTLEVLELLDDAAAARLGKSQHAVA